MLRIVCVVLLLVGCGNNELMTPGQDCLRCHSRGGGAQAFGIAGTLFPSSASIAEDGLDSAFVLVTDAGGNQLQLPTNAAGNFFSRDAVEFPATVSVQVGQTVRHMEPSVTYGGCNQCHDVPPREGAEGRAFVHP